MIRKELRLLITFHTTTDAMAMEQACRDAGADGRLIPVPRSIAAGCGLAWSARIESRAALEALLRENGMRHQEMHECMV